MNSIGFLHTSPEASEGFRSLVTELLPDTSVVEVVDEIVADQAKRLGVDDVRVIGAVADRLAELDHADVVVCTSSTLGPLAERVGHAAGNEVIGIDRAMIERAAELASAGGCRVAIVVDTDDRVDPLLRLFDEIMLSRGTVVHVTTHVIATQEASPQPAQPSDGANEVALALPGIAAEADVVVLAHRDAAATMASVDVAVPVLSSARLAIELIRAQRG